MKALCFQALFFLMLLPYLAFAQPEVPRIDSVVMLPVQGDSALIWYDDFDGTVKQYGETQGGLSDEVFFGESGRSMVSFYAKGSQGTGNRKVFFGDSPTGNPVVRRGESFDEIYWRVYVKHQYGWTGGGPDKLSRATSMVTPNWAQAMIAHVWSSGETLTLDPASGVVGGQVVTTRYNDFDNLHWLGNKPTAKFQIHNSREAGRWVCVESYVKLNTPGQKDGLNRLWLDGRLEAERTGLDWRGTYTKHGVNAVFLETYWNNGSPIAQSRWIDNFVISTNYIGPVTCPRNPVLIKTEYRGAGQSGGWEVELSGDGDGNSVVWRSNVIRNTDRVRVGTDTGEFTASLAGQTLLAPDSTYFTRVREQDSAGEWSAWSNWHQPFQTETSTTTVGEWKVINMREKTAEKG